MENKEKIYEAKEDNQIEQFFKELIARKRFDEQEGGLQACGMITKNQAAFKITENDGIEPHMFAELNLINYLKTGDYINLINRNNFNFNKHREELREASNALSLRITDSDELVLAFNTYEDINSYQLKIIKRIIETVKSPKIKDNYQKIRIGIHAKNFNLPFEMNIDEIYRNIYIASHKIK